MNDSSVISRIRLLAENLSMQFHMPETTIYTLLKNSIDSGVSLSLAEAATLAAFDSISRGRDRFTVDDLVNRTGQSRDIVIASMRLARGAAIQRGENPDLFIEDPDSNERK